MKKKKEVEEEDEDKKKNKNKKGRITNDEQTMKGKMEKNPYVHMYGCN